MRLSRLVAVLAATVLAISPAAADVSATGSFGERITVSKSSVKNSQVVTVKGTGFDETVGLYLAYCVLPKKGQPPTPCGGGANMKGIGDASFWISSNAPPYAKGLVIPFKPGGRFTQKVSVSKRIGKFDCTKVKCAITVRSDHLREGDRTRDLFIPITFTKK
jgi:hypothetical protein